MQVSNFPNEIKSKILEDVPLPLAFTLKKDREFWKNRAYSKYNDLLVKQHFAEKPEDDVDKNPHLTYLLIVTKHSLMERSKDQPDYPEFLEIVDAVVDEIKKRAALETQQEIVRIYWMPNLHDNASAPTVYAAFGFMSAFLQARDDLLNEPSPVLNSKKFDLVHQKVFDFLCNFEENELFSFDRNYCIHLASTIVDEIEEWMNEPETLTYLEKMKMYKKK